jgi:hypothetical protein
MKTEEMRDIVRARVDKRVRITYRDGGTDLAHVLTVDDEGFVYDLAAVRPHNSATAVSVSMGSRNGPFWTAFSEIAEIEFVTEDKVQT